MRAGGVIKVLCFVLTGYLLVAIDQSESTATACVIYSETKRGTVLSSWSDLGLTSYFDTSQTWPTVPHTEVLEFIYFRRTRCETYVNLNAAALLDLGDLTASSHCEVDIFAY